MARIRADDAAAPGSRRTSGALAAIGGWWEPFQQWRRVGGVLAAAALALTAWSMWETSSSEARLQYEAAVEALSTPLDSLGQPLSGSQREKTVPDLFRY